MKNKLTIISALLLCLLFTTGGCKKNNLETMVSRRGATDSHNTGQNCMSCHHEGGKGEGVFTVAGSVFNAAGTIPAANGTVKIFTGMEDSTTPVMELEVDGNGNFFSTEALDFSTFYYVRVIGSSGTEYKMQTPLTTGACNQCHNGSTTSPISGE